MLFSTRISCFVYLKAKIYLKSMLNTHNFAFEVLSGIGIGLGLTKILEGGITIGITNKSSDSTSLVITKE